MPPKSKPAAKGADPKPKPASSANGTSTPTAEGTAPATTGGFGKPDKAAYDAEQESLKKEIDTIQARLNQIKDILAGSDAKAPNEKRDALRTELDGLRQQQQSGNMDRDKIFEQLKSLNESVQKKIKDLNAQKSKLAYKTEAEINSRINSLDKQVESGNMKLADEKRALAEITSLKRNLKTVAAFQKDQDAIDADKAQADELRKRLDDPETTRVSNRIKEIKAELDTIRSAEDAVYADRKKLYTERDELRPKLDAAFSKKRESAQAYREQNDRYWQKVNEDRARRAERARAERAAEEQRKKVEVAERIREEASVPAFQSQIEDCQTLVDYFLGKASAPAVAAALAPKSEIAGVAKLERREVEQLSEGIVPLKKKGQEEEDYFAGTKGKKGKGGKKGGAKASEGETSGELNMPLGTLTALLSLSIPPPSSKEDVPRVVEDLKTKKAWFEANQKRVTAENIAKAEADIARLTGGRANAIENVTPANGGGENPPEPAHTPQVGDVASVPVASDEVVEKLEPVAEAEAAAEATEEA